MPRKARETCTPKELAEHLHIDWHNVTKACRAGAFPGAKQDGKRGPWRIPYSLEEAADLYREWDRKRLSNMGEDGTDWNLERAKHDARIKAATADMRELERDEMLGKYHRAEFVEDAFDEFVFAVRSAVLTLPGKLAPVLAPDKKTTAKYAAIIEDEVKAMLEDLSNYEYNADYYRNRLAEVTGLGGQDDE